MKQRILNPKATGYKDYGGRGLTIRGEWVASFDAFFTYMGPRPPETSLDRINNDGDYEPGNVRWATRSEQNMNRRRAETSAEGEEA